MSDFELNFLRRILSDWDSSQMIIQEILPLRQQQLPGS